MIASLAVPAVAEDLLRGAEADPLLQSMLGGLALVLVVLPAIRLAWSRHNRPHPHSRAHPKHGTTPLR